MLPLSIIVLSHNRIEELSNNIPRLISLFNSVHEFQIIIVDNNSDDGSKEFLLDLKKINPQIELILNNKNLGVGGGRNSGFAIANREYIVALDDDTRISINDLRRIPKLFIKYSSAGILAFRVIHLYSANEQNPHGDKACEVANHHGAGFAFRRTLLEKVGGIDEECNFGAEELDFAIRVRAQGWKILYIPEITVYHNNYTRNHEIDRFRRTQRVYNNVRIYFKYFPVWMAYRNSLRYLLLAIRTWVQNHGFLCAIELIWASWKGYKMGKSNIQSIPDETVAYYNNSGLRPEFGNVPMVFKFLNIHNTRHQR